MAKKYKVTLTAAERDGLAAMISKGRADARKLAHARILLQADEADGGPARTDADIAGALDTSTRTCERVRERFVGQGLEAALLPKPAKRVYARRLDGKQEARLVALACSAGRQRARPAGRCGCWPTSWSNSTSASTPSRMRRCGRR